MSYGRSGTNGYSNGYSGGYGGGGGGYGGNNSGGGAYGGGNGYGRDQLNRYGGYSDDAASRTQRSGGYGGFGPTEHAQDRPRTPQYNTGGSERPTGSPAGAFRSRRRGDTNGGNLLAPNARDDRRRTYFGSGAGAKSLEDVVQHIMDKWTVMASDDCVPVHVALQLMDNSSLGRGSDYDDFLRTEKALQKALRAIVNEHHQGFNSSIGTFHKIQSSIQQSQHKVRTLKTSLEDAKSNLTTAKPELTGLATSSRNYDEMLDILAQIEKIQSIPEQLDAKISDKHFLSAVDVLQDGLRLIRSDQLENIGAISDLRSYLDAQEGSLTDILMEELHDHLYLKSPYCQDRWKPYFQEAGGADTDAPLITRTGGIRPVMRFLATLDAKVVPTDDTSRNIETDSFQYIHSIIEALNKLGRLEAVIDRIEQRLPIELFAVVEKTNQEVDLRHPAHLRAAKSADRSRSYEDIGRTEVGEDVLKDLLFTLYSKFEAIAEGHRAVHEVISGIIQRERLKKADTLLSGFKELWKLYQSEIRSLLHDYLASTSNAISSTRDNSSGNANVFQKLPRDKNKAIFRLKELNKKSSQVASEHDDLDKILQASVPGLVSKSYRRSTLREASATSDSPENHAVTHRMLVEPNVFNISILLPPSLLFLNRLKEILPGNSDIPPSTLTSFLDKFLIDVFNSQLEETVNDLCAQLFSDVDAYQQDVHWAEHAQKPIFRGTISFFYLIKAFCRMLDQVPQDESFAELLLGQLQTYYKKCLGWYTSLVSRAQGEQQEIELKPAAAAINSDELYKILQMVLNNEPKGKSSETLEDEINSLLAKGASNPTDSNMVADSRTVGSLCLLFNSMQWLASHLEKLRHVMKEDQMPKATVDAPGGRKSHRWSLINFGIKGENEQPIYLQMSTEGVGQFDKIATSYRDLAKRSLFTLHTDIRYGIMHTLSKVLDASYLLDKPSVEPDVNIKSLNSDLLISDETLSTLLPEKEYKFMTTGLGLLVDSYMIANANRIKLMNMNGCERMLINILVLQQNLKSLEKDVALTRAKSFFGYFREGTAALVQKAQETGGEGMGVNLEEVKVLVELMYSEPLQSDNREVNEKARRTMEDYMFQLTQAMWAV